MRALVPPPVELCFRNRVNSNSTSTRVRSLVKNATSSFLMLDLAISAVRDSASLYECHRCALQVQEQGLSDHRVKPRSFPASATLCAAGHSIWLLVQRSFNRLKIHLQADFLQQATAGRSAQGTWPYPSPSNQAAGQSGSGAALSGPVASGPLEHLL